MPRTAADALHGFADFLRAGPILLLQLNFSQGGQDGQIARTTARQIAQHVFGPLRHCRGGVRMRRS